MRLANRRSELQVFRHLLTLPEQLRILSVEAPSGYGKSFLLECFDHHCPLNFSKIVLDLREAISGTVYLISQFQRELGIEYFPSFERLLQDYLGAGVEVSSNFIAGTGNRLQVTLNGEDSTLRNFRYEQIQNAFFSDLSQVRQPVLLVMDTFEAAPEELKTWIAGRFLAEVVKLSELIVVIAGQNTPKPTLRWRKYGHSIQLGPIIEVEDWQRFLTNEGMSFNPKEIQMLVDCLEGHPAELMKGFQRMYREQQL
jgi:hypothetical protein